MGSIHVADMGCVRHSLTRLTYGDCHRSAPRKEKEVLNADRQNFGGYDVLEAELQSGSGCNQRTKLSQNSLAGRSTALRTSAGLVNVLRIRRARQ